MPKKWNFLLGNLKFTYNYCMTWRESFLFLWKCEVRLLFRTKQTLTKKVHFFFFCVLQLMTVLLLIYNSYASWSTWFISLKLFVGFRIFYSISFLLNLTFCSTKSMSSLTLKRQNSSHKRATHSFAPRPLIFKLQLVIWKLIDICMSWSSPKSDLERNLLNIKNRSFKCVIFSQ